MGGKGLIMSDATAAVSKIKGRFAPSPSGRMHLGNIYTALAAWLCAKSRGGEFFLRIEDLDPVRCPRSFADLILQDLNWLGLTWDNGDVLYQSDRSPVYETYYQLLSDKDLIYPCFCSRSQLHVADAPHAEDGRIIYPGTCRQLSSEEKQIRAKHRQPAYRVILPDATVSFHDGVYGPQQFNLAQDWGDLIIRRSDGVFAYQLAVTIDDGLTGVTQVVRGRDLLSSAAPQLYLFRTLGFTPPDYLHLPLLITTTGARLAKRERSSDLGFIRSVCPRPEILLGYLGWLLGQLSAPEPIDLPGLLAVFDAKKSPKEDIIISEDYWQRFTACRTC